ncbi:MAG: 50S ribosomal protein L23 [Planctomycetota bacterium]
MSDLERFYRIIRRPCVSEKGYKMTDRHRAYPFEVAVHANKIQVRQAVEALFKVKVTAVRTQNYRGKQRRVGRSLGQRPDWKKAIVVLAEGYSLENFY